MMEVLNGVVHSSISCKLNNTHVRKSHAFMNLTSKLQSFCKIGVNNGDNCDELRNLGVKSVNLGFENKGHLEYYGETNNINIKGKKGWSKISTKKKMKLLKGLSEDLNTFSEFGFGLGFDDGVLADDHDDKGMTISTAAEVLLAQLKQLKLEEDKQKKKEKEDKKKKCKNNMDSSSSSSSSESSDSECGEVVDLKRLRDASRAQPIETEDTLSTNIVALPTTSSMPPSNELINDDQMSLNSDLSSCNIILETALSKDPAIEALSSNKRIEVCMGGKCKKSGAPALMEEFQKAVGDEGVVVGCKCMGKCKTAPNVKLSNDSVVESFGDDSMRTPSNPLYIGVGLEDVELIVSSYFGSGQSVAAVVAS